MKELLLSDKVSHRLVKPLLKRYAEIHTDSKSRLDQLVEMISEIRQPSTIVPTPRSKDKQRHLEVKVPCVVPFGKCSFLKHKTKGRQPSRSCKWFQIAGIRVELNQLREQLDESIQAQDFTAAAEIKTNITELDKKKQTLMEEAEALTSQEGRQEERVIFGKQSV